MVSKRASHATRYTEPAERPRGFRLVLPVAAVLFSALLGLIEGGYLLLVVLALARGTASENVGGLVVAVVVVAMVAALLCALSALRIALRCVRGEGKGLLVVLAWQILSVFFVLAAALTALASGPT